MAFNRNFLARVSTSGNNEAGAVWSYKSTTDDIATITASAYFNDAQAVSGQDNGPIKVGDKMFITGSDASGMYIVTAVSPNVTVATFAAASAIDTAQIVDNAVTAAKLDAAVAGNGLAGGGGTALSVNVDDSTIEINSDALRVKDSGITNAKLAEDTIQTATITVESSELLNLRATPKTLVAAPGAGKFIQFLGAQLILDYNSTAYTESSDNMVIRYTDDSGVIVSETIESTGFIDQTADTITNAVPKADAIVAAAGAVNQALVLHNTGDGEFAAGDSPVYVIITYKVLNSGL